MIPLLAALQAMVAVPVGSGVKLQPVTTGYSIVVARAVRQWDPVKIPCDAPHCTSWFRATFDRAETVAGTPLPAQFEARLEMGSPYDQQYELALLVENLDDGSRRIRAEAGFHYLTKLACFDRADTAALDPQPTGNRLVVQDKKLCVK